MGKLPAADVWTYARTQSWSVYLATEAALLNTMAELGDAQAAWERSESLIASRYPDLDLDDFYHSDRVGGNLKRWQPRQRYQRMWKPIDTVRWRLAEMTGRLEPLR